MKISGITALVTGAASGLGARTAAALAAGGANVVGLDLPGEIEKVPVCEGVRYVAADVTSELDVSRALATLGPDEASLRVVINCAGIAPQQRLLSSRGVHDLNVFRRTVEVNLVGTFNVMRLAAAVIAEQPADENGQRGVIINTASVAAYEGQIGQVAYASSKAAIVGLTLPAARDLARSGIRVNTIAPGIVDTPLLSGLGAEVTAALSAEVPFPKRLARPEEYAQLALMIVDHDYINGETIRMDGAIRMGPQ